MKRGSKINWLLVFVAPLVGCAIVAGLWLSLTAAYENIRLAHVSSQLLGAVAVARDMTVDTGADAAVLNASLINRLAKTENMPVQQIANGQRIVINPWKRATEVALVPTTQQVVLKTEITPVVCRRLVLSYAAEVNDFGLQRVEAWDSNTKASRLMYDASLGDAKAPIAPATIQAGCGRADWVTLALTFRLH